MYLLLLFLISLQQAKKSSASFCKGLPNASLPQSPYKGLFDHLECLSPKKYCSRCGLFTNRSYAYHKWEEPFKSIADRTYLQRCTNGCRSGCYCCSKSEEVCKYASIKILQAMRADGLCDPETNNVDYNYDGGDCCPETCESSTRPFPCGLRGYDCQDPKYKTTSRANNVMKENVDFECDWIDTYHCVLRWWSLEKVNILPSSFRKLTVPRSFSSRYPRDCIIFIEATERVEIESDSVISCATISIRAPEVEVAGRIDASGMGFRGDSGPGRGMLGKSSLGGPGSGAGHGGEGGCGNVCTDEACGRSTYYYSSNFDQSGGFEYGNKMFPVCFGSGGGTGFSASLSYEFCPSGSDCAPIFVNGGGAGGGRIVIIANKLKFLPSAKVLSNGFASDALKSQAIQSKKGLSGGGGSGGSIYLHAEEIIFPPYNSGSDYILAVNGGDSYRNSFGSCDRQAGGIQGYGGPGAGGRISIITQTSKEAFDSRWFSRRSGIHPIGDVVIDEDSGSIYIGAGICTESNNNDKALVDQDQTNNHSNHDHNILDNLHIFWTVVLGPSMIGGILIFYCCFFHRCKKASSCQWRWQGSSSRSMKINPQEFAAVVFNNTTTTNLSRSGSNSRQIKKKVAPSSTNASSSLVQVHTSPTRHFHSTSS